MEALNGIVESIVFKSSDTGYTVIKFRENNIIHTVVGVLPQVKEGQNLKLLGQWVNHSHFGKQFKVYECEEVLPTSKLGIEKYLSSGIIQGIGPVTAKKIVNKFGEETLNILDNNIERLKEIEGIGKKKLETIMDSYKEQRELKNITIFLQTHGLSINQCLKIYKKYGANSVETVKNNPYILCDEISGIGFKTSDKIARSLGVEMDSPFRVQSGIRYVINEFCANGHTFMPKEKLIKEASSVLTVKEDIIEENIKNAALDRKIKLEKVNDIEGVFTIPNYYCELGITNRILTLAISNFQDINVDVDHLILQFEKKNNISFAKSQKDAIISAFQNGIEIITGGPGTGKTTIIKCIIEIFETCGLKVLLGAPTGRAAKRMSESTGKEATTIHRMLDMGVFEKEESVFVTNAEEHSLEADVVIIDEASMIDITLMNALLKSIKVGTRLIIVGDVDQLPSVGAGNVLNDFIESGFTKVVRLKEIFRQGKESMIVVNAHKINKGEMPKLNEKGTDFFFIRNDIQEGILKTIIDLINTRLPRFNSNWDKLKSIQVLVPMKKGILGVTNLNEKLQEVLNPKASYKKEKEFRSIIFREGDKVMQIKNNYSLKWTRISGKGEHEGTGVFNGDMGFINNIDLEGNKLSIIFDEEREVTYDFMYLDELDLAYAITIHKSQGSEFKVVITPAFMGSAFLMNRNILYTGITRAKELVVVVGNQKALKYMVDNTNSMERYSSLKERILDIVSDDKISE